MKIQHLLLNFNVYENKTIYGKENQTTNKNKWKLLFFIFLSFHKNNKILSLILK